MLPNKFVILWNDQPIGLDQDSGGYPFKTNYPGNVKYWDTEEEAEEYRNKFLGFPTLGFFEHSLVREIQFRIMDKKLW